MKTRTRTRCDRDRPRAPSLPARRVACRRPLPEFTDRLYIAVPEDGAWSIDVLERDGDLLARLVVPDRLAISEALLRDATGAAPRPATAAAFADDLLHTAFAGDGLAITSGEVCAWLLLRAIS
jgi:hypothetical protein